MRYIGLALLALLLVACDGAPAVDAGPPPVDAGPRGPREVVLPSAVCPDGWTEVDVDGAAMCSPEMGACPVGEVRFPGQPCAPLGACPAGDFADDVAADAIFVQPGASGDGTRGSPFGALADALAVASAGQVVALSKGAHEGGVTVGTGVTLRGACAAETDVGGLTTTGDGVALLDLTIRDVDGIGLHVRGAARLERVRVEGAREHGVLVTGQLDAVDLVVRATRTTSDGARGQGVAVSGGGARATIERAFIAENHVAGVIAAGGEVTLRDVAFVDQRDGGGGLAAGFAASGGRVDATRVVVRGAVGGGVLAFEGGEVTVADALIRDVTAPGALMGYGVSAIGATIRVERAWIHRPQGIAVFAGPDALVTLEDVAVTDVADPPARPGWGVGLLAGQGGRVEVARVLVARVAGAAASAFGDEMEGFHASLVGADLTALDVLDRGIGGVGLYASNATLTLDGARLERTTHAAIVAQDATVALVDARILDVAVAESFQAYGRGIELLRTDATLTRVAIERPHEIAVLVSEGRATVDGLEIRDVRERPCAATTCAGEPGGIGLGVYDGADVDVTDITIEDTPLCGVQVASAGELDLTDGAIRRAAIGACVQVDGYDVTRLATGVRYEDTPVTIEATSVYVPEPQTPTLTP